MAFLESVQKYEGPAIPPLGLVGLALFRAFLAEAKPRQKLRILNTAQAFLADPGAVQISSTKADRDKLAQARILFEELAVVLMRE